MRDDEYGQEILDRYWHLGKAWDEVPCQVQAATCEVGDQAHGFVCKRGQARSIGSLHSSRIVHETHRE